MTDRSPLCSEALGIVHDLQLLPLLARFGRARLVGSVALDLVVKRDIDLHLLVDNADLWPVARVILGEASALVGPAETHIHTYLSEGGLKVGVEDYAWDSGT